MLLTWYGHSCFLITTAGGESLITDPCDPETGYTLSGIAADAVTVSHNHHDHNYVKAVSGKPKVIKTAGTTQVGDITVTGYPTYHDSVKGRQRGANILYMIEADGLRVLHLGDLGHLLSESLVKELGSVHVLLCPIGGRYTIDPTQAKAVIDALSPRVVVPMHYRTPALKFDIEGLAAFIKFPGEWTVHRVGDCSVELTQETLPEQTIMILNYKR